MPGDDVLWDANDVAAYLKVSRSWVYHHAEAGKLPHLRVGALLRFDPAKIRDFVYAPRRDPTPANPVAPTAGSERP